MAGYERRAIVSRDDGSFSGHPEVHSVREAVQKIAPDVKLVKEFSKERVVVDASPEELRRLESSLGSSCDFHIPQTGRVLSSPRRPRF